MRPLLQKLRITLSSALPLTRCSSQWCWLAVIGDGTIELDSMPIVAEYESLEVQFSYEISYITIS